MSFSKAHIGVLIVAILLVSAFGVGFSGLLMGHDDMGMVGCPLMMGHDSAVCPMSPLAHISSWQNLFAAIPVQSVVTVLLLLLALFFVSRLKLYVWLLHPSPQPVYNFYDPEAAHDPLQRFIARGLMHPKIF
ncbi:MAG TPA: hypothetical protein VJK53_05695 [Candidatus Paceibacterota bacterium]